MGQGEGQHFCPFFFLTKSSHILLLRNQHVISGLVKKKKIKNKVTCLAFQQLFVSSQDAEMRDPGRPVRSDYTATPRKNIKISKSHPSLNITSSSKVLLHYTGHPLGTTQQKLHQGHHVCYQPANHCPRVGCPSSLPRVLHIRAATKWYTELVYLHTTTSHLNIILQLLEQLQQQNKQQYFDQNSFTLFRDFLLHYYEKIIKQTLQLISVREGLLLTGQYFGLT